MAERERKFVPAIVVQSDDLVVLDDDGNEYRPHAGEWVRFRRSVPLSIMRAMTQAAAISSLGDDAPAEVEAALIALVDAIAGQVLDWSWTDFDWCPYPKPADRAAFVEVLWNLDDYELRWLQAHIADGAKLEKN